MIYNILLFRARVVDAKLVLLLLLMQFHLKLSNLELIIPYIGYPMIPDLFQLPSTIRRLSAIPY